MMREASWRAGGPAGGKPERSYGPTALEESSPVLQRMVIIAEDSRFRRHPGFDLAELREAVGVPPDAGFVTTLAGAWRGRDRIRGASTIAQQLAKNLYLTSARSPLRKLKEAVTAVRLELSLSKDRILELYLNVAEFGPGIWGVDRASREYFGVAPARLDAWQAASLAATLPHPRSSNPVFRPERMAERRSLILARYYGADVIIPPAELLDELPPIKVELPPVVIPPALESLLVDTTVGRDTVVSDTVDTAQAGRGRGPSPPDAAALRGPGSLPDRSTPPVRSSPRAPVP